MINASDAKRSTSLIERNVREKREKERAEKQSVALEKWWDKEGCTTFKKDIQRAMNKGKYYWRSNGFTNGDPLFFISLSYMIRNPSVIFNIFDGDDVIKFITTKLVASGYTVRETYNRYFRFIEVCWDLV